MSDYIYNQTKIPKRQWRYGLRSSAETGCGWIAVYNALKLMGYYEDPENLTRYFQNRLPGINGTLGTFLPDLIAFFKKRGFAVDVIKRQSSFDRAVRASDACILFYWWRQGKRLGNHYVALAWRDGTVMGYNTYRNSVTVDRYGISLDAFLRKQRFFWPILIAISDETAQETTENGEGISCSEN